MYILFGYVPWLQDQMFTQSTLRACEGLTTFPFDQMFTQNAFRACEGLTLGLLDFPV